LVDVELWAEIRRTAVVRGLEAAWAADPGADRTAGYVGGKTILDNYLRKVRPLFVPPHRVFQCTV
jgi:hypothetical protein